MPTRAAAPLALAVAQPVYVPGDLAATARAHADAVRAARARVVVFPELSLTGYELDAPPVSPGDEALAVVREACAASGALALVGAPVAAPDGRLHIATLRVDAREVRVAYRKTWLGGEEPARFSPGDGPTLLEVDGWRLGLGICKDTGVDAHTRGTAELGIDLYLAGVVHADDERDELERRALRIARACDAPVAFASFAGSTGGGYDRTAGASAIWSRDGRALARAGTRPGDLARALL